MYFSGRKYRSPPYDEVTKGYDYYGTVVNAAARIEALDGVRAPFKKKQRIFKSY